ncbi:Pathogenicity locus [Thalassoglobus neptunius]|uniref:Pathogenicity locus n=1 Tax=Thalassoglobus neptunius TaxID=1938619 RepID=A0A5C5WJ05_9PLAN|nr:DUF4332 domain-containing protein [Thalassoglobus neptunius]TWT50003.1 Pathogenicity locus [Thalassoglobus neptunius]
MNFRRISIDHFGAFDNFQIEQLSDGLNVLHGSNGSGKSTVLEFLRGVMCGFDRSRKQHFLPTTGGHSAGGGIQCTQPEFNFSITRRSRPGHRDTLAITTQSNDESIPSRVRSQIAKLDEDLIRTIFFVSGHEAHSIPEMLRIAKRDGISLVHRSTTPAWLAERIETVDLFRNAAADPVPGQAELEQLTRRKKKLREQIDSLSQSQKGRDRDWSQKLDRLQTRIRTLRDRSNWTLTELERCQIDLSELQLRLWSQKKQLAKPRLTHKTPQSSEPPKSKTIDSRAIGSIDREIANAQRVLKDLARSRYELSVLVADLSGGPSDQEAMTATFEQQRIGISRIEQEVHQMIDQIDSINQPTELPASQRRSSTEEFQRSLTTIQDQLAVICRGLGQQQDFTQRSTLLKQRKGVDRCERQLVRQIRRLQKEREVLVSQLTKQHGEHKQLLTENEARRCECVHHGVENSKAVRVEQAPLPQPTSRDHSHEQRQQTLKLEAQLIARKRKLQTSWWSLVEELCHCRQELADHQALTHDYANDRRIQILKQEYNELEQKRSDALEQSQSLIILQSVLQRTQEYLDQEVTCPVIAEASELLNKMTDGRHTGFQYCEKTNQLNVTNESGDLLPLAALSRGTNEQASLSFRLALWNEYSRRGVELPLVFDECLSDSDDDRVLACVDALIDSCSENRQILFFTCQDRLSELFEQRGTSVRTLPGSNRTPQVARIRQQAAIPLPSESRIPAASLHEDSQIIHSLQAREPFWLAPDQSIGVLPSLGEQMVRRLGALGVRTIGDLIGLDPEITEMPLDSLQISAATLRNWQAEARLLCCVPNLTGRDAQTLVAIGVLSPSELSQADAGDLVRRMERAHSGSGEYGPLEWLSSELIRPNQKLCHSWIQFARSSRTMRQARGESNNELRTDRSHPLPASHFSHRPADSDSEFPAPPKGNISWEPDRFALDSLVTAQPGRSRANYRFLLSPDSLVSETPGIGQRAAERLHRIGLTTVFDLLHRDAREISRRLSRPRYTVEVVERWQQLATLLCRIPELRAAHAEILVACGVTQVETLLRLTPQQLLDSIREHASSPSWQRSPKVGPLPSLEDVTQWIALARHSRELRAA